MLCPTDDYISNNVITSNGVSLIFTHRNIRKPTLFVQVYLARINYCNLLVSHIYNFFKFFLKLWHEMTPLYESRLSKTLFIKFTQCQRQTNYIDKNFIMSFTIKKKKIRIQNLYSLFLKKKNSCIFFHIFHSGGLYEPHEIYDS